jgi:hypothetical protein
MSVIPLPVAASLSTVPDWMLAARTSSDAGPVVAFLVLGGAFLIGVWTGILLWIRARCDRPLPVRLTTPVVVGALGAVRFKGAAVFAVDGHVFRFGYPFGELVLDGTEATIRGESRFIRPVGSGGRTIRQEDVERILVSRWRPVPYVEFVDDVRTNGITRFSGGPNLVRALRDRGWPVPDDPTADVPDEPSGVSGSGGEPPRG